MPVRDDRSLTPTGFALRQNYPNPFNPKTIIEFTLPEDGRVRLGVYSILGEEVMVLINEEMKAGVYQQAVFDASQMATGIYFARLEFRERQLVRKLLLVK